MAVFHPPTNHRRNAITLLEVLVSMFILAVGILSVFALFLAGRELEARALLQQKAAAYADGPGLAQVNSWMSVGQWIHFDDAWRWVYSGDTTDDTLFKIRLPVMIDPVSLAVDEAGNPTCGSNAWDWNSVAPDIDAFTTSAGTQAYALRRITLAAVPPTSAPPTDTADAPTLRQPFSRQSVLNNSGDSDDVIFSLDATSPDAPPENAFALGRRARNSDFVAALFLDNASPSTGAINSTTLKRWILIHHKPFLGYEESAAPDNLTWPAGSLFLEVSAGSAPTITGYSVLTLLLSKAWTPKDGAVLSKIMQPGRWLLFTHEIGTGVFETEWAQITNISSIPSEEEKYSFAWTVLLDSQQALAGWSPSATRCFAFESIVHVKQLPNAPISIP